MTPKKKGRRREEEGLLRWSKHTLCSDDAQAAREKLLQLSSGGGSPLLTGGREYPAGELKDDCHEETSCEGGDERCGHGEHEADGEECGCNEHSNEGKTDDELDAGGLSGVRHHGPPGLVRLGFLCRWFKCTPTGCTLQHSGEQLF